MIDQETGEILGVDSDEIRKPHVRTPYNYNRDRASDDAGLKCEDPTLAQQHAKDDADINTLVKRFGITGQMPVLNRVPLQGDFDTVVDFKTAMDAIVAAEQTFMTLPADLRARFRNDPHEFLNFTSDEKNRDEMQKLGLLKPKPAKPEPLEVRMAKDPAAEPPKPEAKPPAT